MTSPLRCSAMGLSWVLWFCLSGAAVAEPIGWIERFALSPDREQSLEELTPGTDEYFFFHCLHYQNTKQFEKAEAILKAWLDEHDGNETPVIQSFTDRQRLLTYAQSPDRTIEYLIRRLGVNLQHGPPPSQGERRYPSELDADELTAKRVLVESLRNNAALRPSGIQFLAERFLNDDAAEYPIRLDELLNRVEQATIDQLERLVVKELQARPKNQQAFGNLAAHRWLTLEELRHVAEAVPAIADDQEYVSAVIHRLRPDADSDMSQQPEVRREYLVRLEQYTRTLPPSFNSLKASAAYRLLEANLAVGVHDRELFLRYLALPRISPLVSEPMQRSGAVKAQLNDDFFSLAMLPPIRDEEPLVRTYLEFFLKDAEDFEPFRSLLRTEYLRSVLAKTKLLAGMGDADRWFKMLTAAERQELVDSVQLRLAAENPETFSAETPVELKVAIKNIDKLVVRIYELDSESYYRSHTERIDTNLELDGLIPTHEKQFTYSYPAVRRHDEAIALPEIVGRGVWIVDLVGSGLRARALIRRGSIDVVQSHSADGVELTVIDEDRRPIPGARLWLAAKRLVADDEGRIAISPVAEHLQSPGVISDGKVAQPIDVAGLIENYSLEAAMELDRTELQRGQLAHVVVRPRLLMGDVPIDPTMLMDVVADVESVDRDGVTSRTTIDEILLQQDREVVVPFRVPARLSQLTVTLRGSIRRHVDGGLQDLQASTQWQIGQTQATNQPHDAYLTRNQDAFVVEVRGRSGEPVAGAPVAIQVETDWSDRTFPIMLQTDAQGRVNLGPLTPATRLSYGVESGTMHTTQLPLAQSFWPGRVHTTSELGFSLPLADAIEPSQRYRLLSWRDGAPYGDVTSSLKSEGGRLVVDAIAPGDYRLVDRETGAATEIIVVAGPSIDEVAVGPTRHAELSPQRPLGIESVTRDEAGLHVKVSGDLRLARLHVFASRFLEASRAAEQLQLAAPALRSRRVTLAESGYVSDLRLGDEYQYVLRRRFAAKYPGVMLPQPSLLLNPWETESTQNERQEAVEGDAPPPSMAAAEPESAPAGAPQGASKESEMSSDYGFLADRSVVLANLRPGADGTLLIPADELRGLPIVQVVLVDPVTLVQRVVASELGDVETIDLRLPEALDAETPYTLARRVNVASKDQPLDLSTLGSGQLQVYASAMQFFELQRTLLGDARFAEFGDLMKWPTLDREAKLAAYGRLASHETHLLLWAYDRPFFDEVIRPYLQNKKEKDFVDAWLLEQPLDAYRELWRYGSLNAAEKALLGMRVGDLRSAIERELREHVTLRKVDERELRRIIDSAIAGEQLRQSRSDLSVEVKLGEVDHPYFYSEYSAPMGAIGGGMGGAGKAWAPAENYADLFGIDAVNQQTDDADGTRMFRSRSGRALHFSRPLDTTKQWAESHWDRVRAIDRANRPPLITENAFWLDLVQHGDDPGFLSSHLLEPIENRHAALVALAFSGLPFEPPQVQLPGADETTFAPESAVLVVSKHLKKLESKEAEDRVLLGQRFQALEAATGSGATDPGEPTEFLVGVPYQGQLVVSNLTNQKQTIDVFWQIPAGSVPLAGGQSSNNEVVTLEPFAVHSIHYTFYFPASGEFVHYPATVSAEGQLLSRGSEKTFRVLEEPSQLDPKSWAEVSRRGTPEQIDTFLREANLRDLNWSLVLHRMSDRAVYDTVLGQLRKQKLFVPELYAYSLKHRDEPTLRDFVSLRGDLVSQAGPQLDSPLLVIDPIERSSYEHLEYAPLVQPRIHRLGEHHEILNPRFMEHYREFLTIASYSESLDVNQRLATVHYLLIQNRIDEAIEWFNRVDADTVEVRLQYDYLDAYLAMHQEDFARASDLASRYVDHPVHRWRERFQLLSQQLAGGAVTVTGGDDETPLPDSGADLALLDREREQAAHADAEPFVAIRAEGETLHIDHRRARNAELHFYGVDLELLFSKAPFVREDLQRMSMVQPIRTEHLEFDSTDGVATYQLDPELRRQTLLVVVQAGSARSSALSYGGEISTYLSEGFGQLQVTDRNTRDSVSKAYVKVYARMNDGSIRFYKDGYTDSRGRFDYASVSGPDASGAQRFAILVLDEQRGATLHDVAAPNR